MSTKAKAKPASKQKSAVITKAKTPKGAAAEKKAAPATKKKGASDKEAAAAPTPGLPEGVDAEELEEAADEAASKSSNSNAAAAAAAAGSGEMSASFKNFRHHPDMENFYRFIFDNDLRHEALAIMNEMLLERQKKKQAKLAQKS